MCTSLYGNETDQLSLLEFKKAISLDPQQALMSWNDSTYFCSWEGVLCRVKTPHRVISLNLTNQGLVGQISPSLGNLTFLKFLFLDTNSFTGEIPLSLGHLHHLRTIYLSNNTLEGAIPDFTNCSRLKVLCLNGNHLVGQLNNNFPPKLQVLTLAYNNLTGTIPSSFANITGLRKLDFTANNIKGNIPNEFSNFLMMEILLLGGNMLTGRFPQAILNLSTLTNLHLSFNHLSGELPSNFLYSLPNLQVLALDYNFFQGHIPSSLGNDSNIRVLDISSNNFTGVVPSSIGKLSKLYWLNLQSNQLQAHKMEDWEFMNSLANCTRLQSFSMAYNRLEGHLPSSLSNFSAHLQRLHLGGNAISGSFPSGIEHLSNLIALSVGTNDFTGTLPEWLGNLKQLQMLSLYDNYFTGFIPSSLSNLSQLVALTLQFNKLDGQIPSLGNQLRMLQIFNVLYNNLHGVIPNAIFSLLSLIQVDLSYNNLHGQLPIDIGNAKQLVSLKLSSNKLSGDILNALGDCESLEVIRLDRNNFSGSIPISLGNISSLRVLNLSLNNLTGSIPVSLSNLQYLEKLNLSFNHLKGEIPAKGIFKNATAFQIDENQGLCGGPPALHLTTCPIVPLVSSKHNNLILLKVMIPLACMVSLATVISIIFIWRAKLKRESVSLPFFGSNFPRISYNALFKATEGFSTSSLIGRGRYGSVFVGKLFQENNVVAVKVFSLETRGAGKSFIAECNALRNVWHRNIVPILTACSSIDSKGNDFKALVYEFMSHGDLYNLLYTTRHDSNSSKLNHISLAQRTSIVLDVSSALEYLHHNNQGTIVHCDLNPSNILLDKNMIAHVGDFGLARFKIDSSSPSLGDSNLTSSLAIRGTIGYIAPECSEGGQVSTASDVFSFGVVLLELFIRRRPIDDMFKDGLSIAKHVEMNFPDRILEIVDPQLQHELDLCQETPMAVKEKGIHCLRSVLNIGLCCTNPTPSERISITTIRQYMILLMASNVVQIMCTSLYGNETDRLSLLEFKKAISLDPQQALMSWNDSTYFFSWEGVLCRVKTPHRLISLNLTNQGLVGQISPSLGNLTFLKFLFLDTNSFTGEIPLSLGHLHHLRTIYLSNNTLEGAIPDFTNCSSLKALRLNGNHLVGQLINNFPPKLQVLTLASNNFTGTIPSSFANITELRNLNFASNNIKGNIPNEFSNFLMMEILILGGNMLTGRFPQAILNISTLIDLFLNFNHLSGEVPSNILYSLPNLQVLALDFNFLQGHIPSSLVNASNLRVLDISSNNFTGVVPSSIGKLSKLYWLSLEGNQLRTHKKEDWEFMNSLANCTRLQIFSMAYNRLEGHLPSSLSNFSTHLQRLHLDGNAISGFLPSGIEHLSNLIDLSLGTNDFTGTLPEWLGNLKQLQMLGLYENYFIGFIPSSLSNLSQLVYLGLHFNKFDGHIPSLGNLQMLEVLNISNNNLHCIIPTEIFSIMSIVQIDLSFNNLHGKFPTDIGNAKQLISLELSSNKLSGDIPNALGNCESLEYIMLGINSFSGSIPISLGNISNLKVLNLSHNNLTWSIPASLSNLQYLEQLDMSFKHLNGEVPVEGIFKNATAFQMDGNQGLCGGLPELHLPACPTVLLVTYRVIGYI
uniref:Receptor kinase-like protein Xa21 n=1 Tax=Oryza rufipogon TaxID=4529 RepID=A0A0E0R4T1_ORYRU